MNFNLIPWDPESYLIAADYYEEQGFLIPNAIRNKILPLEIEVNNVEFSVVGYGWCYGEGSGGGIGNGIGIVNGSGWGDGSGVGFGASF